MKYSGIERRFASYLKAFPAVFHFAKLVYQLFWRIIFFRAGSNFNERHAESVVNPKDFNAQEAFFGYYDRSPVNELGTVLVVLVTSGRARLVAINKLRKIIWEEDLIAFNYQQGCLATWLPCNRFIFNCIEDGCVVGVLVDLDNQTRTVLPDSFQAVGGEHYASINIKRLNERRPEYGYVPFIGLNDSGASLLRLRSIVNIDFLWDVSERHVAAICGLQSYDAIKVNHVSFSPDGKKFVFVARWFSGGVKTSALLMGQIGGKKLVRLLDTGVVSHYCWCGLDKVFYWGRGKSGVDGYHILDTESGAEETLPVSSLSQGDGHPVYLGNDLFVTDTYPDKTGRISLYAISKDHGEELLLALKVPFFPRGSRRTDFHPRFNPHDGHIYFDSNHLGRRGLFRILPRPLLVNRALPRG